MSIYRIDFVCHELYRWRYQNTQFNVYGTSPAGSMEGFVIFPILERSNDGLGREAVAYGIAARTPFAFWCCWPGAFQCVAAVGFDLCS